jgi:hypothetical protein
VNTRKNNSGQIPTTNTEKTNKRTALGKQNENRLTGRPERKKQLRTTTEIHVETKTRASHNPYSTQPLKTLTHNTRGEP